MTLISGTLPMTLALRPELDRAEALARAVKRALETGVPLVDVAYLSVTTGDGF